MPKNQEKVKVEFDLREAYVGEHKDLKYILDQRNKTWFAAIRLVITLSTSILLLSVALIDEILPIKNADHKNFLFISWISFFAAIIFGIISELLGSKFFKKMAEKTGNVMERYIKELNKGKKKLTEELDLKKGYFENPPSWPGIVSITAFFIGILCLFIYFIANIS